MVFNNGTGDLTRNDHSTFSPDPTFIKEFGLSPIGHSVLIECIRCKGLHLGPLKTCDECRAKARNRYWANRDNELKRGSDKRERNRDKLRISARNRYYNDKEHWSRSQKKHRLKLKMQVVEYYSGGTGKCSCCGESEIEFLTLHHINNDGKEHKKRLGVSGTEFYRRLIQSDFPDDPHLDVLCLNCNMAIGFYGKCPHDGGSYLDYINKLWDMSRTTKAKQHELNAIYRLRVLEYYSNGIPTCQCCGIDVLEFLSLDHKDGNGAKHRKEVGNIYLWTIRNNYPDLFRVLCHSCNNSRGYYGYCPHEERRKKR